MSSPDALPTLAEVFHPKLVNCRIREYLPEDRDACLALYHTNIPGFLTDQDADTFVELLEHGTSYLLVAEHDTQVVACGSLELLGDTGMARIIHDAVHRDYQRKGIGSTLLAARLSLLEPENEKPVQVFLRAKPEAAAFYSSYGFSIHTFEKNIAVFRLAISPEEITSLRETLASRGIDIELNPIEETADWREEAFDAQ